MDCLTSAGALAFAAALADTQAMRYILISGPNEYWRARSALDAMRPDSSLVLLIAESTTTITRDDGRRFSVDGDELPDELGEWLTMNNLSNTGPRPYKGTRIRHDLAV